MAMKMEMWMMLRCLMSFGCCYYFWQICKKKDIKELPTIKPYYYNEIYFKEPIDIPAG